jgi:hypothetical protein
VIQSATVMRSGLQMPLVMAKELHLELELVLAP